MKYFFFLLPFTITVFFAAGCESSSGPERAEISDNYYGKVYNWDKGGGYYAEFVYQNISLGTISFPIDEEGLFEMTFPDTLPAASLLEMRDYLGFPDSAIYGWESYNFKIMYGSFSLVKDGENLGALFHYQKSGDTVLSPQYAVLIYSSGETTIRGLETVKDSSGTRNVYLDLKLYRGWNKAVRTFAMLSDTVMNESYTRGTGNLFNLFYYGE